MKAIKTAALAILALGVAFTSGCEGRHSTKEVFYLIATNVNLPYWQTAAAGFKRAAAQYKDVYKRQVEGSAVGFAAGRGQLCAAG